MNWATMQWGQILAILGAVLSVSMAGMGSARGVKIAGEAVAGVCSENPDLFGRLLALQVLPATQGIYGFLVGFIVLAFRVNIFGEAWTVLSFDQGLIIFLACLPTAIVGLYSGIRQGETAASAVAMVGRQNDTAGKGITMTVLVETYAVLALLASILTLLSMK